MPAQNPRLVRVDADEATSLDAAAGFLMGASLTHPHDSAQLRELGRVCARLATRFLIAEPAAICAVCDGVGCEFCPKAAVDSVVQQAVAA